MKTKKTYRGVCYGGVADGVTVESTVPMVRVTNRATGAEDEYLWDGAAFLIYPGAELALSAAVVFLGFVDKRAASRKAPPERA